ncbi:IS1096 element passenger TnpR family protein [Riemerella columbina]|uniref:IS1096 element passenger TnpR family protein n=1 Tax=Riemerella columbina TaxID=103810 RepID=UPI00266FE330|nr:hypothetical protein [Riemerella columbina]WKS95852.1 hypothetical protein NYR17_03725 [Riemerella columbina]
MVCKIRVILDTKENVFRDIEIRGKQTLWNLHNGIKSAFSLQGDELSSFYFSDEDWSELNAIPLEDMSDDGDGEIMSDIYITEAFPEKGSKMLFKYGFIDLWEFYCELLENVKEKPAVNYPITVFRYGNMPLKAPTKSSDKPSHIMMTDDFDEFEDGFDEEDHFDAEEGFDDGFDTEDYY